MYKIRSINCIFSRIEEDKVREKIYLGIHELCNAWMDRIERSDSSSPPPPLLLIESREDINNLSALTGMLRGEEAEGEENEAKEI